MKHTKQHVMSVAVFGVFGLLALGSSNPGSASSGSKSTSNEQATPAGPSDPDKPSEPTPAPKAAVEVTAMQLFNDYQANEVAADEKYKDKTLRVTGKVQSIDKDFLDNIVLKLSTSNQFMSVMATLEDSEKSKAAQLSKGTSAQVVCTGNGMVIGSPALSDCTLQ